MAILVKVMRQTIHKLFTCIAHQTQNMHVCIETTTYNALYIHILYIHSTNYCPTPISPG